MTPPDRQVTTDGFELQFGTNQPGHFALVGPSRDTLAVRMIRALSARGILVGTVESAKLPALMAATDPGARGGALYGPSGPGHYGGPPAEQSLYPAVAQHRRRRAGLAAFRGTDPGGAAGGQMFTVPTPEPHLVCTRASISV